MSVAETAADAAIQLSDTLRRVDSAQINSLIEEIDQAKRLFFAGTGRSLLMMRCIAMRMMHLAYESYVVGDTTTPAFESGDLLIIGSGSGETDSMVNMASKAKTYGGKVAVMTISKSSTLGQMSDLCVEIPAYSDKVNFGHSQAPILPGGSLFEQCLLILGDSLVLPLASRRGIPLDQSFTRHANLE